MSRIGESLIGLLVDSVDTIFSLFDSDVMPIPLLSKSRAGMFAGCVTHGGGDILFLDHRQIFSQAELLDISSGHVNLYQDDGTSAAGQSRKRAGREVYITFALDGAWAVPIRQVREILPFCEAPLRPPGLPAFVHGILTLRGQVVTLIDLRGLYGLPPCAERGSAKMLMIEEGEERYGLIVDAVDNIVTVDASARRASPRLLCAADPAHLHAALNLFDRDGLLLMLGERMRCA